MVHQIKMSGTFVVFKKKKFETTVVHQLCREVIDMLDVGAKELSRALGRIGLWRVIPWSLFPAFLC